jgi:uncharacterized protein (DUF1330 family)
MKTKYTVVLTLLAGVAVGGLADQALHAQAKPPVYLVSMIDVNNPDAYAKDYVPKVRATIKASGGRVIAASPKVTPVEGEAPTSRVAINVFDSVEKLQAWRNSSEFKEARKIGDQYAKFRSFIVEGVQQ